MSTAGELQEKTDLTLRETALSRSAAVSWAEALEGERLSHRLNPTDYDSGSVAFNSETAALIFESVPIYPTVPGFGNLDTSMLSEELKSVLQGFCSAVLAKKDFLHCKNFFEEKNIFLLALFLSDVSAFDAKSYLWGAPFFVDDHFEIPVRFFCKDDFFDCSIFINAQDGSKINQVRLSRK